MSAKPDEKEEPTTSIREKCVDCIRGPNLIKTVVVVVCFGVVVQQITTCVQKLIDIPITTYSHFDFNRTIKYPSITFCREPPYKYDKMLEYGLYAHPRFTSTWRNYNFSIPLDKLWQDITYEASEFFVQFGLDGLMENVEVTTTIGFIHGRCYTLSPKILNSRATKESGYSITLRHSAADVATSIGKYVPGYHAFVHYTSEPFTEVAVYNGGMVDYIYCNLEETIEAKLTVNKYLKISEEADPCVNDDSYSANSCTSQYVWDKTAEAAGCSGPWMRSDLPPCASHASMTRLIARYISLYQDHNCTVCPRFCVSYMYSTFVNNRHSIFFDSVTKKDVKSADATLQTQLYLYFNNMMVTVYEERYNYDWSLFLSDLGGSVGFLLGLSVIGLMTIFGKFWSTIIRPTIKAPKAVKDSSKTKDTKNSISLPLDLQVFKSQGCLTCNKAKTLRLNYY